MSVENISLLPPTEVRIGVVGNVDAGKSSFVGVMTHPDILDNGRGFAREFIAKHKHEIESGRTSAITQNYIRTPTKITDFIDLAGHEKYLKTTIKGINSNLVDYAVIMINANAGIQQMTREHIGIVYTLRLPIIVIYSKIDITPTNIYEANLKYIQSFFNKNLHINTHVITTPEKIAEYAQKYCDPDTDLNYRLANVPIITVSNVVGTNIPEVRNFLTSLQQYHNYAAVMDPATNETNFIISTAYNVKGVGLVVSGIMKTGTAKNGDIIYIGPFHNHYYRVVIRGIHNNFREQVEYLAAGYSGCFAIKPVNGKIVLKRNMLRTGLRCVSNFYSVTEFEAKVKILQNPSTISRRYTPIIQCSGITQPAHILDMEKEYLRSFDESVMRFKFIYRPEYIENGSIFVFREGLTKGIGKIQSITKNPSVIAE